MERINVDLKYTSRESEVVKGYLNRHGLKAGPYLRALLLSRAVSDTDPLKKEEALCQETGE